MPSVFDGVTYTRIGPQQWLEQPSNMVLAIGWELQTQTKVEDGQRWSRRVWWPQLFKMGPVPAAVVTQMLESCGQLPETPDAPPVQVQDAEKAAGHVR